MGGLPFGRANPSEKGGRSGREYLLNQQQCDYLITRCELPIASETCKLIAKVFRKVLM